MKIISRYIILVIFLVFSTICKAVPDDPASWVRQTISETPSVKVSADALNNFNFSDILQDNRVDYLGYIGDDYQRLWIFFQNVQKISPTEYAVAGYSEVKTNRCYFKGTIEIEALYERTELDFGVDDWMKGKVKKQGFIVANFSFSESAEQKGSGKFNGNLITNWYVNSQDELLYDNISEDSDAYSNNQFSGNWTSYRTNISKRCAWGQYRIPCSGDLDTGAAEFSVNPKYLNNGWGKNVERNADVHKAVTGIAQGTTKNTISEEWFGNYSISINYGRLDEFSEMTIDYDIEITPEQCIFSGLGYKTYFTDRCRIEENGNELRLLYIKSMDGDGFTDHSDMVLIATLYKTASQYFIKSPVIADENWEYNRKLMLKKIKI